MLVHSLPEKSRKRLPCGALETLATQPGFVYNITDTDWRAHNGSTHNHAFITFQCQIETKMDAKLSEKLQCWVYMVFTPYLKNCDVYGFYSIPEKLWCVWFLLHSWKTVMCMVFIPFLKNCDVYGFYSIPEKLWCVWFLLHSWKTVMCMVFTLFLKNCDVYGFYSIPEKLWCVWFLFHSWKLLFC